MKYNALNTCNTLFDLFYSLGTLPFKKKFAESVTLVDLKENKGLKNMNSNKKESNIEEKIKNEEVNYKMNLLQSSNLVTEQTRAIRSFDKIIPRITTKIKIPLANTILRIDSRTPLINAKKGSFKYTIFPEIQILTTMSPIMYNPNKTIVIDKQSTLKIIIKSTHSYNKNIVTTFMPKYKVLTTEGYIEYRAKNSIKKVKPTQIINYKKINKEKIGITKFININKFENNLINAPITKSEIYSSSEVLKNIKHIKYINLKENNIHKNPSFHEIVNPNNTDMEGTIDNIGGKSTSKSNGILYNPDRELEIIPSLWNSKSVSDINKSITTAIISTQKNHSMKIKSIINNKYINFKKKNSIKNIEKYFYLITENYYKRSTVDSNHSTLLVANISKTHLYNHIFETTQLINIRLDNYSMTGNTREEFTIFTKTPKDSGFNWRLLN